MVEECLALSHSTGEAYYLPQLLLMKARCLRESRDGGSFPAARDACMQALDAARQGAMWHIVEIAQTELRMLEEVAHSTTGEAQ